MIFVSHSFCLLSGILIDSSSPYLGHIFALLKAEKIRSGTFRQSAAWVIKWRILPFPLSRERLAVIMFVLAAFAKLSYVTDSSDIEVLWSQRLSDNLIA